MRTILLAACLLTSACHDAVGLTDGTQHDGGTSKPGITFVPLACGAATCNFAAGESCCVGDDGTPSCVGPTQECAALYVPCDRASQCAQGGDAGPIVCCADYESSDAGVVAKGVECVAASECNAANARFPLCGGGDPSCPSGTTCGTSTVALPSFQACLGNGVQ